MAKWNPSLKEGMEGLKKVIEADTPGKEFKPYQAPVSLRERAAKFSAPDFKSQSPAQVVKSGAKAAAGKILGAAAGQAAGVLLTPTPAGEGSDKVPSPSKRQMGTVDRNNPEYTPRAKGGPVQKGKKYIVGEKGPETFVPKQTGKIVPAPVKRQPGGMGRPKVVSKGVTKMPFKKK